MNPLVKNTDQYLKALAPDRSAAVQKLREQIMASAPGCTEYFGYGLPGFKLNGRVLLYMGASKKHCALYGMIPKGFDEELKDYDRSKGAIRFTPDKPIPAKVVKAIVKILVAEIKALPAKGSAKKAASKRSSKRK